MNENELKDKIIQFLLNQGFNLNNGIQINNFDKTHLKHLHIESKKEQINLHRNFLLKNTNKISKYFINGNDINPEKILLSLVEIKSNTIEDIIFRWWNLIWWSVPYQKTYGRQMRFLIWDEYHNAPFGLIGLQSPVLKLPIRDKYLNIPNEKLDLWINQSLQAQRLGALPPYNDLIGGKMVALAVASDEIREKYKNKYKNKKTILKDRILESDLLFTSTTSAFGKSSIYNRLNYHGDTIAKSAGFTSGFGSFQIPEYIYQELLVLLKDNNIETNTGFGHGPSRKMKLIKKACNILKLPDFTNHNIKRECFVFLNVSNLNEVIYDNKKPVFYHRKFEDLFTFWKDRWCLPRSKRTDYWKLFKKEIFIQQFKSEYNL